MTALACEYMKMIAQSQVAEETEQLNESILTYKTSDEEKEHITIRKSIGNAVESVMLAKNLKNETSLINKFAEQTEEFKSSPLILKCLDDLEFFYFIQNLKKRYSKEKRKLQKLLKYQHQKDTIKKGRS